MQGKARTSDMQVTEWGKVSKSHSVLQQSSNTDSMNRSNKGLKTNANLVEVERVGDPLCQADQQCKNVWKREGWKERRQQAGHQPIQKKATLKQPVLCLRVYNQKNKQTNTSRAILGVRVADFLWCGVPGSWVRLKSKCTCNRA